jgi:ankyrin repeat protein
MLDVPSDPAVETFLAAVHERDAARASRLLREDPRLVERSIHVAAAAGDVEAVRRQLAGNAAVIRARAGNPSGDALLYVCYSPFHGESGERDDKLLATAKLLLAAGADPNTTDGRYNVPALFAVTGARSVLPMARLLLDAGAKPTDGESVFHAAERFHEDALELLLAAGADLNYVGDWGNTALYFLLRWYDIEQQPRVRSGFRWLLDHGADPNVTSGGMRETALHLAARSGQQLPTIRLLLDHGAEIDARRADGATAWLLARRGGYDEIGDALEAAGAQTQPLSALDEFLASCSRGDVAAASRLASPQVIGALTEHDTPALPEAAARRRWDVVRAFVAGGFPVNATDDGGATALHYAALNGNIGVVRALLAAHADVSIRDREHTATPLGWAEFCRHHRFNREGGYEACIAALRGAEGQ